MMKIIKSSGALEEVDFNKVLLRVKEAIKYLNASPYVSDVDIAKYGINTLHSEATTTQLDYTLAEAAHQFTYKHPDYNLIGGYILRTRLSKNVKQKRDNYGEGATAYLGAYKNSANALSEDFLTYLNNGADYHIYANKKDTKFKNLDYFGMRTLMYSYLFKDKDGDYIETPNDMYARVVAQLYPTPCEDGYKLLDNLLQGKFTFGTPTLFNAGREYPQLSSCFLLDTAEDSLDGIFTTISECARISKYAGGLGVAISKVRPKGSHIKGTGGKSNGIVPMIKTFESVAKYIDQGGGKRKGSISFYLEPWHPDIFEFLDLRKPTNDGKDAAEHRARDIFTALWVPDAFMRAVENDAPWYLVDPSKYPLQELWGEEFDNEYSKIIENKGYEKEIKARDLMTAIIKAQIESGTPYILYKDRCNEHSTHKALGTIKSSNLCSEIIQYTDSDTTAVCNLASIALPEFVKGPEDFDFEELTRVVTQTVYGLNRVIDTGYVPTEKARKSNLTTRAIGLGVQGLADVFFKLGIPYDSDKAKRLNSVIFKAIYEAADKASKEYYTKHMIGTDLDKIYHNEFKKLSRANSLLIALMPTASTSQVLGNTESFEPLTSNLYTRNVLGGTFWVTNKYLVKLLEEKGLWNDEVRTKLIENKGSVSFLKESNPEIYDIFKTVWETPQKVCIDMAADRQQYICQSQSMNLYFAVPTISKVYSALMHGWRTGLKTGQYYLRSKAASDALQFTLLGSVNTTQNKDQTSCSILDPSCESCSG